MGLHAKTKKRLTANKIHRTLCPICRHPDVAAIEHLAYDFWCPTELIRRFQLVGPDKPYHHKSSACRGIKRHMLRHGIYAKRKKNVRGAIRLCLRHGDAVWRYFRYIDPVTRVEISLKLMSATAKMEQQYERTRGGR